MSEVKQGLSGPDLRQGVALAAVPEGAMLLGHVQGEPVLLARRGDDVFAIGAVCTHYGASLADGLLVGDTVRCPWHHACFDLQSGRVLRAPALDPVPCWRVERSGDTFYVREKRTPPHVKRALTDEWAPRSVVIVGGGVAGNAAAETLRVEGFVGNIAIFGADEAMPCDRPNLSKGFLAGTATDESNLLRSAQFYRERKIELHLGARVDAIDAGRKQIMLTDGTRHAYDALLLATGAQPNRLDIPGSALPHVHYLRTLADGRALVLDATSARRAVVIGAGFIGLEVAASLRARNIEVAIVGPDAIPMERLLGAKVGEFIRRVHESHGVTFYLGTTAISIDERSVTLKSGENIQADLVVVGIGVSPAISLAEGAGLTVDRGVIVNEYLETSALGIFAVGDIARWPDPDGDEYIRVEHFVVAERQGRTAARNILGLRERFDAVPFFWTEQYDLGIAYIGHAKEWDRDEIDGSLEARDCTITYWHGERKLAVATIHRDLSGLVAEVEFEKRSMGNHDFDR